MYFIPMVKDIQFNHDGNKSILHKYEYPKTIILMDPLKTGVQLDCDFFCGICHGYVKT